MSGLFDGWSLLYAIIAGLVIGRWVVVRLSEERHDSGN